MEIVRYLANKTKTKTIALLRVKYSITFKDMKFI